MTTDPIQNIPPPTLNPKKQVMLFAQGVETAEALSGKIVLLFQLCEEQLSPQPHYDFGLRVRLSMHSVAGGGWAVCVCGFCCILFT